MALIRKFYKKLMVKKSIFIQYLGFIAEMNSESSFSHLSIDTLAKQSTLSHGLQTCIEQSSRYQYHSRKNYLSVMPIHASFDFQRWLKTNCSRLFTMLVQRMFYYNGKCMVRDPHRLALSILSRSTLWRLFSNPVSVTCAATIAEDQGNIHYDYNDDFSQVQLKFINCVVFHPTAPLIAISSIHNTALWGLSSDNSTATCVETAIRDSVECNSIAFHRTEPIMAIAGKGENFIKLFRTNLDGTPATHVATLKDHICSVTCLAFHPTELILASGSCDNTTKLWHVSTDYSSVTYVVTLWGHRDWVNSVAFHPTDPFILATCSDDHTVKLWCFNSDYSEASCIETLREHLKPVTCLAFHPILPLLATGSEDCTAKVWYISLDESSVTCIATLDDEKHNGTWVTSVAFHPNAPLLATGCHDGIANLWRLPHNSEVTCVGTIHVGVDSHTIVAFHPTEPLLAISVNREGLSHCVKLWR